MGLLEAARAAYDVDTDDDAWLRGVLRALRSEIDQGLGCVGFVYEADEKQERPRVLATLVEGADPLFAEAVPATIASMDAAAQAQTAELVSTVMTSSELLSGGRDAFEYGPVAPFARRLKFRDFLGIRAADPTGVGCVLGAPLPSLTKLTSRQRWSLDRIAAHMSAALRLRRALRERGEAALREAEIDAGGKLVRAEGVAGSPVGVRALCEAALRRQPSGQRDDKSALRAWQALIDGRWSLVDRFEQAGRRITIAYRNELPVRDPRGLSEAEWRVARLLSDGLPPKAIAYRLGISEGTVKALLARARAKVGANSTVELVQHLHPPLDRMDIPDVPLVVLSQAVEASGGGLTPAEREVVALLVAGQSNQEIAAARGVSPRTIANQLAAIYRKLGVSSRVELVAQRRG